MSQHDSAVAESALSRYRRGKTDSVIALLVKSPHLNLDQIADATSINRRCVNALIYALEIQQRILADDYDLPRCDQKFTVLRAQADRSAIPKSRRIHPKVERCLKAKIDDARQYRPIIEFFSHGIVSA